MQAADCRVICTDPVTDLHVFADRSADGRAHRIQTTCCNIINDKCLPRTRPGYGMRFSKNEAYPTCCTSAATALASVLALRTTMLSGFGE